MPGIYTRWPLHLVPEASVAMVYSAVMQGDTPPIHHPLVHRDVMSPLEGVPWRSNRTHRVNDRPRPAATSIELEIMWE